MAGQGLAGLLGQQGGSPGGQMPPGGGMPGGLAQMMGGNGNMPGGLAQMMGQGGTPGMGMSGSSPLLSILNQMQNRGAPPQPGMQPGAAQSIMSKPDAPMMGMPGPGQPQPQQQQALMGGLLGPAYLSLIGKQFK